jgi:2-methylcitrate dehydratase PrpD
MRDAPHTVASDTAFALATFAAELTGNRVPSQVVATTKRFVLDAIGVALAGSTAPGTGETLEVYRNWGGGPEATVFARGASLPAPHAALVNAVMLHSRDFDDTHDVAIVHAYAAVLPSALAAAEAEGNVDGYRLLAAIVAGVEIACRLGLALRHYHGWHNSAICGVFGAAAAAGRVLQLSGEHMRHALGIAYSQAAGNVQCIRDGALTKRMQLGFAAQAGVSAAYLARAGITGTTNTFDGPYGFLRLYDHDAPAGASSHRLRDDGGAYGAHELVAGLGARFEAANLSMKPYPNSRAIHPAIAGALALRAQLALTGRDIVRVTVAVSQRTYERVGARYRPDFEGGQVQAQFNLRYGVAVALSKGRVGLADFEPDRLQDAEVLALAERVDVVRDSTFRENLPVRIAVETRDGRHAERLETTLEGAPDAPMSRELCEAKFRQCCELAARPFAPLEQDAVIATVDALQSERDVRVLARLLA